MQHLSARRALPVDAIAESPNVFEYPRALRRYFRIPVHHAGHRPPGPRTEESKPTMPPVCGPRQIGASPSRLGDPRSGCRFFDVQKITRAIARAGVHKIEPTTRSTP